MKNTKYQLQNFLLFDYAGVEKCLDEMARKGWKLEKSVRCSGNIKK